MTAASHWDRRWWLEEEPEMCLAVPMKGTEIRLGNKRPADDPRGELWPRI